MAVYLITYDLKDHASGYDYKELHDTIKQFGPWCHPLESTWIVDTHMDPELMSGRIRAVYQPEKHLIIQLSNDPLYWGRLSKSSWDWIKSHLG